MAILKAKRKTKTPRHIQRWDTHKKNMILDFLSKYSEERWAEKCRLWEEQYGKARPRESLRGKMNYLKTKRNKTYRCQHVESRQIDVMSPMTELFESHHQRDNIPHVRAEIRTGHIDDGHISVLQEGNAPSNLAEQN
jgi:hypothetical protein